MGSPINDHQFLYSIDFIEDLTIFTGPTYPKLKLQKELSELYFEVNSLYSRL